MVTLDTGNQCFPDLPDHKTTKDIFTGRTTTLHTSVPFLFMLSIHLSGMLFKYCPRKPKEKTKTEDKNIYFMCPRVHKLVDLPGQVDNIKE